MNSQAKRSQHEGPVISVADIKKEKNALRKTISAVLNQPKAKQRRAGRSQAEIP